MRTKEFVNAVANEYIKEFMRKGYVVDVMGANSLSMQVDSCVKMINGSHRIAVCRESHGLSKRYFTVTVRNFDKHGFIDVENNAVKESKPMFEIAYNWVTDEETFIAARLVRDTRRYSCRVTNRPMTECLINDLRYVRAVHKWLKKQKGMKTVHLEDITDINREKDKNGKYIYYVEARGKEFTISR